MWTGMGRPKSCRNYFFFAKNGKGPRNSQKIALFRCKLLRGSQKVAKLPLFAEKMTKLAFFRCKLVISLKIPFESPHWFLKFYGFHFVLLQNRWNAEKTPLRIAKMPNKRLSFEWSPPIWFAVPQRYFRQLFGYIFSFFGVGWYSGGSNSRSAVCLLEKCDFCSDGKVGVWLNIFRSLKSILILQWPK